MNTLKPPKLAVVTFVYWFLLLYMIAALAWWFIALEKQNTVMTAIRISELLKDDPLYLSKLSAIEEMSNRKTAQYIGEGITFLALILVGAVYVYRATRRQLKFSAQQQNFMMAITHELKTPIAVAQLNLETLQKRKLEEDKQQKLIANTLQEANRLNTLCNNILFTSQLDAGGYSVNFQELNLTDIVETCVDDCKSRFPERVITEAIEENRLMQGDPFLLQMLVNNLLENALKYSPKNMPIHVSLSFTANKNVLSIADLGQGIADQEKKKVFDKFYRSGSENTRKAQGTGLGLYLCKKIAETHNGYISVTDNQPNGSIFTVLFKLQ
ncbi:MAG TPA: ATP-binding protein [Sediminibacterium sp.]|uniref:sensor histidine kinase n=1 Tax=Sediminibacterium sp. TaxID=1917865 RepID=UPI0008BF4700|nr:ATP-binding protein [Sediminibacterium sp.]OHC86110.1 MAG: two-component sensor histidine kinase [Sphingobacteriia bacterium RIFOXYC2_FULL_35_18]OHC89623.1 MAG: two-component sensor histidine kinase [Sphingobacteriia bacterium RIFOXYD2_FULL_35_12]OYY07557.1 MAG: two-component sensor histidine kinase [Sphingobacteriia bacterium 35-36-14]OYZ52750.1 MAG: two-component sensor histidine kinase [Sphingobacteriia bacterium 24-36-13]OZA63564.1 MAG: two-component sensor histidine kinase [Sphingobact